MAPDQNISRTIPIELEPSAVHSSAQKAKNATFFKYSAEKEYRTSRPNSSCIVTREIQIVDGNHNGQRADKFTPREELALTHGHVEKVALKVAKQSSIQLPAAKTESLKNDDLMRRRPDEGKKIEQFSDYIRKVKDKLRTVSSVGLGRSAIRRDSFNDKVSDYINRAKFKIRTTSNVGDEDRGVSFR